jgi:alpha-ketoglutarate-dependent taurine dioxygenase
MMVAELKVPYRTRPLSLSMGLEVMGVDLEQPLDAAWAGKLVELFTDAGVLLFRGAGTSNQAHVNLSRCFGELERHSVKEAGSVASPNSSISPTDRRTMGSCPNSSRCMRWRARR